MVAEAIAARSERVIGMAERVAVLDRVTKKYGAVTALDGVSLELRRGEIVALLGPNGAGKSTAVRLLLGLATATSGTVRIFDGDPRDAATRTRVGAMLQVSAMPKTLTVREHIDLFRSYYPQPLSVAEIERIAQLEGIEDRMFGELSGGQKQRLLFGLAMCGDPEVIFLDEPTVGLDIEARRGLWEQIRSLARRGKTVLMTTHYLEEADALAHRIIVISKGKVVSEGTPAEIKSLTSSRKIGCVTTIAAERLWELPGVIEVEMRGGTTWVVAGDAEGVVRWMLNADPGLHGLEVVAPGLEDAFLALTHE
jgi:ABC-2 type transport system ATP-binding protein